MTEKETKDNSKKNFSNMSNKKDDKDKKPRGSYEIKKENLKLLLKYIKKIKENETPKS